MNATERPIKCVVWDLDDTLWQGVLSEGDATPLRPGVAALLRTLDERGVLHAVSSRNDAEFAQARLRELGVADYFLYVQANWSEKSTSIERIAQELDIGLDSMLFIDDQPFERAEVESRLPEVRCLAAENLDLLLNLPSLARLKVTPEASNRRLMYRQEAARREAEDRFEGPKAAFMETLGLALRISLAAPDDLARLEELCVRTNQLNTTGRLYDRAELEAYRVSPSHALLTASLTDRFGDYGKIGLALVELGESRWTIRLLLMSCRVISRGAGSLLLHHLMRCARAYGVTLEADFVPNDRNRLMMMTYRFAGFRPVTETRDGHPSTLRLDDSPIPCVPAGVKLLADPSDFARETLAAPAALAVHFAAHSAACPQACALIHRGQTWRYAELRSEVARIAQALTDAGVAPGDFVAVHLDRSPQLAATVLAIWSLAAAYSALPVDQPRERLAAMARTVHAKVLVVDGRARSIRPPCSAQVVIDLADVAAAAPDAGALLVPRRLPHRLAAAYCIHTSGSTGTPKGVVNTHEGVVNLMRAQRDCFGSLDDCRVLQAASFGFDAFVFDLTLAFGARGTLVIVDDDAIVGSALAREVTAHEVTHATLTPSVLAQTDLRRERSLRCVISAGERFLPLALDHLPVEARIHNAYGPTEAAVWSLVETVPHDWPRAMPPPLGRPISGVRVTADGAREGAGASGDLELSVSGPCLAWGYPADPVATALRFVPDPTGTPGSRRYLTGDRVSQLEDGRWCFEGRLDDQVKLNGVRVELREVERALEQHPEVAACCVVGHAEAGHVVRLFAAIVPRTAALPPATLAKETLDRARQGVPASWLPAMVEIVPTLPLTAHGKRDRAAIAQALDARWLERLTDERSTTATARSASLEVELMATLWREVLGVTNTTASDNFFALGGNSLKLIQLRRRITEVFGNAPSVAEMYEARTLSDLVAFVQRRSAASGTAP